MVKKNINVFKLIIYVQEDFQFLLIKMHTNENRFWMIKEDENKYAQKKIGKCEKKQLMIIKKNNFSYVGWGGCTSVV